MGTVTINLAGFAGNAGIGIHGDSAGNGDGKGKSGQVKNGTIFAGNVNPMSNDRVEQKRASARKQATKALMDQFGADSAVTDRMGELRARNKEIKEELSFLKEQKSLYEAEREALKEKYGVEPGSEEQKQLDLIRKVDSAMKTGNWDGLTMEELTQVAGMDKSQLTEYQRHSLEYDKMISVFDSDISELEKEKRGNTSSIVDMKQGLLKTSYKGIMNAYKTADAILDAASSDIIGMLWQDAKNHIDEEMQKLVEAAKKKAEEKEEEEKKLEAAKEKKEEQEELTEAIREAASEQRKEMEQAVQEAAAGQKRQPEADGVIQELAEEQEELQEKVDKILKDADLLEEDLKGLIVDGLF